MKEKNIKHEIKTYIPRKTVIKKAVFFPFLMTAFYRL